MEAKMCKPTWRKNICFGEPQSGFLGGFRQLFKDLFLGAFSRNGDILTSAAEDIALLHCLLSLFYCCSSTSALPPPDCSSRSAVDNMLLSSADHAGTY